MESLREFFTPRSYNNLSFFVVVLWVIVGTLLFGIFAELKTSEPRYFNCDVTVKSEDKNYIQGKCIEQYEKEYNRALPIYGFIIFNFSIVGIACTLYSIAVKSRVDAFDNYDQGLPPASTHRLFIAYCLQLTSRIILGLTFIILLKRLYPFNFPTNFSCEFPAATENPSAKRLNGTVSMPSAVNNTTTTYACHNQRATWKTFWANIVLIINVAFVVCVVLEGAYLGCQVLRVRGFTTDLTFYKTHLAGRNSESPEWKRFLRSVKEKIKNDTDKLEPLLPCNPGEGEEPRVLKFDDIYTNMVIHPERARYKFGKERHEMFEEYLLPSEEDLRIKEPEDIFPPRADGDVLKSRHILVVGRPGIGKTLLCEKLARDWASGKMQKRESAYFEIVFLVKFRRFKSSENVNVQNLLKKSEYSTEFFNEEVFNYIQQNPKKVLLIFDGLDECDDLSSVASERQYENNMAQDMPFPALYGKLASGQLLSGVTVLTSTRPTAVENVNHLHFDRTVEMLGFKSDQVEEYVERFMRNDSATKEQVWNHISTNMNILSLCYVPVNCFIVCSYLREVLRMDTGSESTNGSLPKTLTRIYSGALRTFLLKHSPCCRNLSAGERKKFISGIFTPDEIEQTLPKIEKLALKATTEGRLIFELSEVEGTENCGLFHQLPDRRCIEDPLRKEPQYCFLHLTIQEFLAAKALVKENLQDLKAFVSENIRKGKWQLVIQFVAGLLHDLHDCEQKMTDIFTNLFHETVKREYTIVSWPTQANKLLVLTLCKCIFEFNKLTQNLIQGVVPSIVNRLDFSALSLTSADCVALVYVLRNMRIIPRINFSRNHIGSLGLSEICKLIGMGTLSTIPVDKENSTQALTHIDLDYNSITDEGVKHLCGTLSQAREHCKLTHLYLSGNSITDEGVKQLCGALSKEHCKLALLNLSENSITDEGVKLLCGALAKEHCKLALLNLSKNSITDEGVKLLCGALSKEHCKLAYLYLWGNSITDEGVKHLCGALSKEHCKLAHLDLSKNSITDEGVKHLCGAIAKEHCKLSDLGLRYNSITAEGVKQLCGALSKEHCKLAHLYLSENSITDEGVKLLCGALAKEHCKLAHLNLSKNSITDEGVKLLCGAIAKEHCKLAYLGLWFNLITDEGVKLLCGALCKKHCKLAHLDLSENSITDEGVKHLCGALSKEHCKLAHLSLSKNSITDECIKHLYDAVSKRHCQVDIL